jgi:coenzyme F420-0:L-glutamate ligase/coenzyme F420-1:gamma-L-glutamate ligase
MPAKAAQEHVSILHPIDTRSDASRALYSALDGRRSIRRYHARRVPKDLLDRLFTAAASAPSAHNRQPWRFVVIENVERKAALARAMAAHLEQDRSRDGDDPDDIRRDVERSIARITGAPVVIVVGLTLEDMDAYPDARRARAEFLMAVQSTAMATQNLLVAAHVEGLGACWMCAPLFCSESVCGVLDLPAGWQAQGLVTLGYPLDAGKRKPRKATAETVSYRS